MNLPEMFATWFPTGHPDVGELAAHGLLHVDDETVGDLHQQRDALLECLRFPPEIVQHPIDVAGDPFDFVQRIAIKDRDQSCQRSPSDSN